MMRRNTKRIPRIHDEIFQFLFEYIENHGNCYFMPRKSNQSNRLALGYWFLGNDDYLSINFYKGSDDLNKTGNIIFGSVPGLIVIPGFIPNSRILISSVSTSHSASA